MRYCLEPVRCTKATIWHPASPWHPQEGSVDERQHSYTALKSSMRVGRTPANRLYPAELSDRINVLQPQQTENQLAQSPNQVHSINEIHRKHKWRWKHRHKLKAIGICALLSVTTCVLRSTVTYSKVSPPDATSYDCTDEARYESWPLQCVQLRLAIDNVDCWFERCYLTDAPCCSVKLLPADNWQANGTGPQTHGQSRFSQQ